MKYALLILTLFSLSGCFRARELQSETAEAPSLPPVQYHGVPITKADERPVVKTDKGYEMRELPGITPNPLPAVEYTTYVGPSN